MVVSVVMRLWQQHFTAQIDPSSPGFAKVHAVWLASGMLRVFPAVICSAALTSLLEPPFGDMERSATVRGWYRAGMGMSALIVVYAVGSIVLATDLAVVLSMARNLVGFGGLSLLLVGAGMAPRAVGLVTVPLLAFLSTWRAALEGNTLMVTLLGWPWARADSRSAWLMAAGLAVVGARLAWRRIRW